MFKYVMILFMLVSVEGRECGTGQLHIVYQENVLYELFEFRAFKAQHMKM